MIFSNFFTFSGATVIRRRPVLSEKSALSARRLICSKLVSRPICPAIAFSPKLRPHRHSRPQSRRPPNVPARRERNVHIGGEAPCRVFREHSGRSRHGDRNTHQRPAHLWFHPKDITHHQLAWGQGEIVCATSGITPIAEVKSVGGAEIFTTFPSLSYPLKSLNIESLPEIKGVS